MKKLLLGITVLSATNLFAQDIRGIENYDYAPDTSAVQESNYSDGEEDAYEYGVLDSMLYHNEMYFIYPYLVPATYYDATAVSGDSDGGDQKSIDIDSLAAVDYSYAYDESWQMNIPYVYQNLPDGKYVILQENGTTENRIVRAEFTIENSNPQGFATFYDESGQIAKTGAYVNGEKTGLWTTRCVDCLDNTLDEETYDMGVLHGKVVRHASVNGKTYVSEEGEYIYGQQGNNYKYFAYCDESKKIYLQKVYGVQNSETGTYQEFYCNGKLRFDIKGKLPLIITEDYVNQVSEEDVKYNFYALQMPMEGECKAYYENGRLVGNFSKITNEEGYMSNVTFDILYHPNGKKGVAKSMLSDTLGLKRYNMSYYSEKGKLKKVESYTGDYIYERWEVDKKGKLQWTYANFEPFIQASGSYGESAVNVDSLLLKSFAIKEGNKVYTYIIPSKKGREFVRLTEEKNLFRLDFEIKKIGKEELVYNNVFQAGDIKVVFYNTLKNTREEKRETTVASVLNAKSSMLRRKNNDNDSVRVYFQNKLFTGDISAMMGDGKQLLKVTNQSVLIDLMAYEPLQQQLEKKKKRKGDDAEFAKELQTIKNSYAKLVIVNGDPQLLEAKLYERKKIATAHIELKNGKVHGKMITSKERVDKEGNLRSSEIKEENYVNGLLNGHSIEKQYSKDYNKTIVEHDFMYCNGEKCDTSYYYGYNGALKEVEVFNKSGKREGTTIFYYENGSKQAVSNYYDGKLHGVAYTLTEGGDTLGFETYKNGSREGAFMQMEQNEEGSYKLYGQHKNDEPTGTLTLYDPSNKKRVVLQIDSAMSTNGYRGAYYDEPYVLDMRSYGPVTFISNWQSKMTIAGKVKYYTAEGIMYCSGQYSYDPSEPALSLDYGDYAVADTVKAEAYIEEDIAVMDSTRSVEYTEPAVVPALEAVKKRIYNYGMYKTGIWKYYTAAGKLESEVLYREDYKMGDRIGSGYYKEYYSNGKIKYEGLLESEYDMGTEIKGVPQINFDILFSAYNNAQGINQLKNGNGKVQVFYPNGNLQQEFQVRNHEPYGKYVNYDEDGKTIIEEGEFNVPEVTPDETPALELMNNEMAK